MRSSTLWSFLGFSLALGLVPACSKPSPSADGSPPSNEGNQPATDSNQSYGTLADAPTTESGSCGAHAAFGTLLQAGTLGDTAGSYDGPALVERSTEKQLVLAFQPTAVDPPASPLPAHVTILGLKPMPVFPLGARVWLSKDPAGNASSGSPVDSSVKPQPWSFWLRDHEGGRILFGATRGDSTDLGSPVPLDRLDTDCAAPTSVCSEPQVIYSHLDVHGDSTVRLGDSETASLRLGGFEYQARVTARQELGGNTPECGLYGRQDGVTLELLALDLRQLIAGLEIAEPPACREGNDDPQWAAFELFPDFGFESFAGAVHFEYETERAGTKCLSFGMQRIAPNSGQQQSIEWCVSTGMLPEPSPGEEFSAVLPTPVLGALREAGDGALLYGRVGLSGSEDATETTLIETTLGTKLRAVQSCAYAGLGADTLFAVDALIGDDPPQRLSSNSHTVVQIAGRDYDVWATGLGAISVSLVAR